MAAIYCEDCGADMFERLKSAPSEEGDGKSFTKVVIGPIVVDGCRCNSCNCPVDSGDAAVYVSHHNREWPDNHGERDYLDMRQSKTHKI